jgi:hypothetical protein
LLPNDEIFVSESCTPTCGQSCRDCVYAHVVSTLGEQIFPIKCPSGTCVLSQGDVATLLDPRSMLRFAVTISRKL